MAEYEQRMRVTLAQWEKELLQPPGFLERTSKRVQTKINEMIPDKVHAALTSAVRGIVKSVQIGLDFSPQSPPQIGLALQERDELADEKRNMYKKIAAAEGAGTGAGGFVLSLVDFPALIAIKMKFLFELAHVYGFSTKNESERLFILYVFQLAFSRGDVRARTYQQVRDWDRVSLLGSGNPNGVSMQRFNWEQFQMEYRDTIDFRKMLQLIPGVGAAIGAWANYGLLEELSVTAKNSYRLRWLQLQNAQQSPKQLP
nr:EcsC family protein [Paenibacillus koleovorans]